MLQMRCIEQELNLQRTRLKQNRKELQRLPAGRLIVKDRGKWLGYYVTGEGENPCNIRGIARNRKLVMKLARKRYLTDESGLLQKNIEALEQMSHGFAEDLEEAVLSKLPVPFKRVPREYFIKPELHKIDKGTRERIAKLLEWDDKTKKEKEGQNLTINTFDLKMLSQTEEGRYLLRNREFQKAWANSSYPRSNYRKEELKYESSNGMVRTKAELLITKIFDELEIPYHYEEEIPYMGVNRIPDFLVLSRSGELFIVEYWGLLDDPEYRERREIKLAEYAKAGIFPWTNLIELFSRGDAILEQRITEATLSAFLL